VRGAAVRRDVRGQQQDPVERQRAARRARDIEMADVNRVERAPEQA
jgi:hypothetical protein